MAVVLVPLFLALGAATWSLAEYVLHRFWFHGGTGKHLGSREHLLHHAGIDHGGITTLLSWAGVWLVGAVVWGPAGWFVGGVPAGIGWGTGWVVGFYFYEYHHWDAHRRGPRTGYTRWLRRHHLHHHFGAPRMNHGVTSPIWDHVFGTYEEPGTIRLPRRMAGLSVPWMIDDDGLVRSEYADDYEVVGRLDTRPTTVERDQIDAFASVAPAFELDDRGAPRTTADAEREAVLVD